MTHRLTRPLLLVLAVVAWHLGVGGCSVLRPTDSDAFSVEQTQLSIERTGVRSGRRERIWLDDGRLHREVSLATGETLEEATLVVTPALWASIREVCEQHHVWDWEPSYRNPDVTAGVSMTIKIRINGRVALSLMENRGPAFDESGVLTFSNYGLGIGEDLLRAFRDLFRPLLI